MPDPLLSVIVPARDAESTLPRCLQALCCEVGPAREILVDDDGSEDRTGEVARSFGLVPIRLSRSRGPAAARNQGARAARADGLLFVDADTEPVPGLLSRALAPFASQEVDALVGSYDDQPDATCIVSRFKNLAHHHFHQRAAGPIETFWGACGAIRIDLFLAIGGFDEERCRHPSIEDLELGLRLHEHGARIRLDPELEVKHLKKWSLVSLITTDVLRRAVPWTRLCLERGDFPRTLNLGHRQRIAALASLPLLFLPAVGWLEEPWSWVVLAACPMAVGLNLRLFHLFLRRGGPLFAVAGFFLQQLYYLYSWLGLGLGVLAYLLPRFSMRDKPLAASQEESE